MDFTSVTLGSDFDWLSESVGEKLTQPLKVDATNSIPKNLDEELNIIIPFMDNPI